MDELDLLECESIHKLLYQAHKLGFSASDNLHKVIVKLTEAGRHADKRAQLQAHVDALTAARDALDAAMFAAGDARSQIIRVTGCDGTCA